MINLSSRYSIKSQTNVQPISICDHLWYLRLRCFGASIHVSNLVQESLSTWKFKAQKHVLLMASCQWCDYLVVVSIQACGLMIWSFVQYWNNLHTVNSYACIKPLGLWSVCSRGGEQYCGKTVCWLWSGAYVKPLGFWHGTHVHVCMLHWLMQGIQCYLEPLVFAMHYAALWA